MLLIAESGSSKTDWRLLAANGPVRTARTAGFNPYFQTADEMYAEMAAMLPGQWGTPAVNEIFFYGAGCSTDTNRDLVRTALGRWFGTARIHVGHDLLAAARGLCGRSSGIVCILGTGVNACLYNGTEIVAGRPSLGFWLGDEGGGGYLGKQLVQHYFHAEMPPDLHQEFGETYRLTLETALENAYRKPFPNSYFAAFARFLAPRRAHPYAEKLLLEGFGLFLDRYVAKFEEYRAYPVHFTGSIAYHYQDLLRRAAAARSLHVGRITDTPITGLVDYHAGRSE